jgi:FkbM family methyltransferase
LFLCICAPVEFSALLGSWGKNPSAERSDMEKKVLEEPSAREQISIQLHVMEERLLAALDRLSRLEVVERRLEEAIAYFAARSNRLVGSQSVYLGDHTAVTFLRNGLRILVDTRSIDVGIHLLTLGEWEPIYMALFDKLLKPGDTVLDIGANHGVYALHAALAVGPKGCVHAFEPNPRLARLVDYSLKLNGFGNYATLHPFGVSDTARTAKLLFSEAFSGGGVITNQNSSANQQSVDCRLVVLDELFSDTSIKIDVIKMDVEGHEGLALRGMRDVLARSPNVKIMMEFGPEMMARAGVSAQEILSMLENLGFVISVIGDQGELHATTPSELLVSTKNIQNILLAREMPRIFV